MIQIHRNEDCCGCNACGDICPKHAISFKTDIEGFWYPEVDQNLCIDCGLCEKVCPVQHPADGVQRFDEPRVFAAYTKDEFVRLDSTSGGIHSMLANAMYAKEAFVGGAVYNSDHTVSQIIDDNPKRLPEIRSSKYIQSNAEGVYKEIRNQLKNGKEVFFCGTPCQIHALYKYLGNKEIDNLITCDFICRGVNSPKAFLKYMEMLERQYGSKAKNIKFKAKKWGWHNFSLRVEFENGKEYCKDRWHDLFFIGYLQAGNFTRPSCYECHFKGFPQKSDITLADFWGIEKIDKSMDQDKGTSLVMVNSEKGLKLFESIKDSIECREFSIDDARKGNPAMDGSLKAAKPNRKEFFEAPAHALTHRKDRICIVLGDRQSDRLYIGMRIVIRIEVAHDKRRLCSKPFSMLKTAVAVYNKVIAPKIASDARVICDACPAYDHASVILFLFSFEFFHTLSKAL